MKVDDATRGGLAAALGELLVVDPRATDLETCERLLPRCRHLQSFAAAIEAELVVAHRRLAAEAERAAAAACADGATLDDDANGAAAGGIPAPDGRDEAGDVLTPEPVPPAPTPRESPKARQQRLLRGKWLTFYPALNSALAAGTITTEHVDALATVFERTPPALVAEFGEPWLLHHATTYSPEGFAAHVRDEITRLREDGGESEHERQVNDSRAWIGRDRETGMYRLHLSIDPWRGAQLQSMVEQRINQLRTTDHGKTLRYGQLCLQAVLDLIQTDHQIVPEALVFVDHQTTQTGWHPDTVCENIDGVRLPVSIGLAACATGNVTAAIIDRTGKVIDYGTSSALADKRQRHLQRVMYDECAHPECEQSFTRCEIHHVTYRANDGQTLMSNLVPLCFEHHHQLHDHGWTLTMDTERTLRWHHPDGALRHTVHLEHPTRRRRPTGLPPGRDDTTDTAAADRIDLDCGGVARLTTVGDGGSAYPRRARPTSAAEQAHHFDPPAPNLVRTSNGSIARDALVDDEVTGDRAAVDQPHLFDPHAA